MSSPAVPIALQFLPFLFAGWASRRQQAVIAFLLEENRVLREQLGGGRLRLSDSQRRRLAVKGRALGRKALSEIAGIVTPRHHSALVPTARGQHV
jgi:putative transposase